MKRKHHRSKKHFQFFLLFILTLAVLALAGSSIWILAGQNSKQPKDRASVLSRVRNMMATAAENFPTPSGSAVNPAPPSENENKEPSNPDFSKGGQAQEILSSMSLEEKVGQMLIARCPAENAVGNVKDFHLGGYILFAQDFQNKTPEQAAAEIQSYQDAADIPLLIGVDEEGGTVTRISRFPAFRDAPFPSPQELYTTGGFNAVREDAVEKCQLLKSLGINVNFAQVCDISENPDDFIYKRSFGRDAVQTSEFIRTVVEVMKEQGVASTLKHFPGYGNNADTHTGIAYDNRPYETFESSDFLPFQAGIDSGADLVLVSHNIVSCMDGMNPASLSSGVHQILRNDLHFSGVIVTDDLSMEGVLQFTGGSQAAVLAVQAGNDLLCSSDFASHYNAILDAVKNGDIQESQIDESVLRILNLKIELGLL